MGETKGTSEGSPSVKQLVLRVTPKEASELIGRRLRSGNRIARELRPQSDEEQLSLIARNLRKWDEYNSTLLRTIFTTPSFASKYVGGQSFASPRFGSLEDRRRELIEGFHRKRTELESIKEQLVFFDKAPQSVSVKDEAITTANTVSSENVEGAIDKRNVVVVYGRNKKLKDAMFDFLTAIGLRPLDWIQLKTAAIEATGRGTPYIGEIVDTAFEQGRAVVVLLTGDDEARLRKRFRKKKEPEYETEFTPQARPNVLFEAGMAMGKCDDRTILVEIGTLRPWTDVSGRHVTKFDGTHSKRHELTEQLKAVGCEVDTSGSRWIDVGDFAEEPDSQENGRSSEASTTARGKGASTQRSRRRHVESEIKIGRAENTKVTGVDYSGRSLTPATKSHVQIHEIEGGEATGVQAKETDNQVKG